MTLDQFIIFASVIEFSIFWILQVFLFRYIRYENVLKWLVYVFMFNTVICTIMFFLFGHLVIADRQSDVRIQLVAMLCTFVITSLLIGLYIIGIFGMIESSIRIKLLSLVAQTKSSGIMYKDIINKYNKQVILSKRLKRLQGSGDIIYRAGKYYTLNRLSAFSLVAHITKLIACLYKK